MFKKLFLLAALLFSQVQAQEIFPPGSSPNWRPSVETAALLPLTGNHPGDARTAQDTGLIYGWNGSAWADQGASLSVGDPITGGTPDCVLYLDSSGNLACDATNFKYDSVGNAFSVGFSGTSNLGISPNFQILKGATNNNLFINNDVQQGFGFNVLNPQYVVDVRNTRQPEILATSVTSGSGIDTPTSGGSYVLTTDANINITIIQVDIMVDTESCPFNPGDQVTSPGGAGGLVVSDSGTLIVVSNNNTATAAFSPGETITDTTNACTAHTTANLDYFNWSQNNNTSLPIAIDLSAQIVGNAGTVTATFASSILHTLGDTFLISVLNFPLFRLIDSNGASRFLVGNDGSVYSYNALGGAQFISDDNFGLFCHGDCETINTGARSELDIDEVGSTWNYSIFDQVASYFGIDTLNKLYFLGDESANITLDERDNVSSISSNSTRYLELNGGAGTTLLGKSRSPSTVSTNDLGTTTGGDTTSNGNSTTWEVNDQSKRFSVVANAATVLQLDGINKKFNLGDQSSLAWLEVSTNDQHVFMGDINHNGAGTTFKVRDDTAKYEFSKRNFKIGTMDLVYPSANGNGALTNDGAGNLSWSASSGFPNRVANVDLIGQTSGVTTTILSIVATGLYRFSGSIVVTSAGTAGTISATLGYNNGSSAQTPNPFRNGVATLPLTTIGNEEEMDYVFHAVSGTAITIKTTTAGLLGSPVFSQFVTLERLE